MLKFAEDTLTHLEKQYPGIRRTILFFENADLPACTHCGSADTAQVLVGIVGRSINIVAATTKAVLLPNGPKPGQYRCNTCGKYFG